MCVVDRFELAESIYQKKEGPQLYRHLDFTQKSIQQKKYELG